MFLYGSKQVERIIPLEVVNILETTHKIYVPFDTEMTTKPGQSVTFFNVKMYLHSLRGGKSYFMHFNHMSNERDFPQRSGSVRGEDVPFALGLPISPLFPHNYTIQDIKISRTLVRYLSNFAHTGNPNESPIMHISQTKHNHIATPMEGMKVEVNTKKKRQMGWSSIRKRKKRNRNIDYYDEDSDESEHEDESSEYDTHYTHNRDRLEDTNDQPYPYWESYDTLNQYYLEIGNKFGIKNHYRGHKLSLWLNLIPQLHMPGELNELSMRHHHFSESDAKFYDGIVRVQNIEMPVYTKSVIFKSDANTTPTKAMLVTTVAALTDCPSNTTVSPTLAATRPQKNAANNENKSENQSFHMDGFLRHLTSSHFHSYSAALAITIGVGCFLLLLNILIFAAIYYQRVKRTLDAKRKEQFVESDMMLPNFIDRCIDKRVEKNCLNMPTYSADLNYEEYNRFVEKAMHCGQPFEKQHKCKSKETHVGFVRIPTHSSSNNEIPDNNIHTSKNDKICLSTYPSSESRSSLSEAEGSNNRNKEFCDSPKLSSDQSTQSEFRNMHDVGTTVTESDVDVDNRQTSKSDDCRAEKLLSTPSSLRSSISTSNYQGGILRQPFGPTTPSTTKKRVQIQEISV